MGAGVSCLQLGQLKASALFFAQALRDPTAKVLALQSSAQPVLDWAIAGQFREAREYARLLAEVMPNEVADSVLAYAEFARLMHAPESDHDSIAREQIAAMDRAASSADSLLASVDDDSTIRRLVAIGAGVTALTCRWLGDDVRATLFRELAVRLDREDALNLASWFTKWDQLRDSPRPITEPLMQFVGHVAGQSKPHRSLSEFRVAA